jgi:hypothetical protein
MSLSTLKAMCTVKPATYADKRVCLLFYIKCSSTWGMESFKTIVYFSFLSCKIKSKIVLKATLKQKQNQPLSKQFDCCNVSATVFTLSYDQTNTELNSYY